jgi:hypothetical protein
MNGPRAIPATSCFISLPYITDAAADDVDGDRRSSAAKESGYDECREIVGKR